MYLLIDKVDRQIRVQYPQISSLPEKEIVLSFLIWGASHVLMESKYDETMMVDTLTRIAHLVIQRLNDYEKPGDQTVITRPGV